MIIREYHKCQGFSHFFHLGIILLGKEDKRNLLILIGRCFR